MAVVKAGDTAVAAVAERATCRRSPDDHDPSSPPADARCPAAQLKGYVR